MCSYLKDKGMQTQCEVNNFSRLTLLSKLNSSPLFHSSNFSHLQLSSVIEGSSQNVSNIWKAKDHRSPVVTWKPNTIFHFWAQILMYVGCSGEAYVYSCCIVGKVRTCGKKCIFISGICKKGLQVCIAKWKKSFYARLHRVRKCFL